MVFIQLANNKEVLKVVFSLNLNKSIGLFIILSEIRILLKNEISKPLVDRFNLLFYLD